jgi:hypothetical protein
MNPKRISIAIEIIDAGEVFNVNGLQFQKRDQMLLVSGWSNYVLIQNIDRDIASKELHAIKDTFHSLLSEFQELKDYIGQFSINYALLYDDNGKCSITICEERGNSIIWKI